MVLIFFSAMAFADADPRSHNPIVTLSPGIANCTQLGNTFIVNIANQPSSIDNIAEVRIYEGTAGLSQFYCGTAPTGWQLFDFTGIYGYCEYKEIPGGTDDKIHPNEDLNFTFQAIMSSSACYSSFQISTLDDASPTGEHQFSFPQVQIDCVDPYINKSVGTPKILLDPQDPSTTEPDYWINHNSLIQVDAYDSTDDSDPGYNACNLGLNYCQYQVVLDGTPLGWNNYTNGEGINFEFSFAEDSEHYIEIECYDIAGNMTRITELDKVDGTYPETTKTYGTPFVMDGYTEWINTNTPITLTATDPDPTTFSCNIGVESTWYRIIGVPNSWCEDPVQNCLDYPDGGDRSGFMEYTGTPFNIPEESCHYIDFYSVDYLGNTEPIMKYGPTYGTGNWQCAFVDNTPPLVEKNNGNAILDRGEADFMTPENQEGAFHWITQNMPITFTCTDQQPHPVGNEELCYKVSYDYPNWGYITNQYCDTALNPEGYCCVATTAAAPLEFYFQEESKHNLEYYCTDGVGNESTEHTQYYKVDTTPPSITKQMLGTENVDWRGACPPGTPSDVCYVAETGGVRITATDGGPICAVDSLTCFYEVWWNNPTGQLEMVGSGDFSDYTEVTFTEDSTHELRVYCTDALGNDVNDNETFLVDFNPPETTKAYGEPTRVFSGYRWIGISTPITMTAVDNKVGVDSIHWRVTQLDIPDEGCFETCFEDYNYEVGSGDWSEQSGDTVQFVIPEESCHYIEFYSKDLLNNTETTKHQCVFVDNTAPNIDKNVGEPKVACEAGDPNGCDYYVTQNTPITLECHDLEPHPSDDVTIFWNVYTEGTSGWELVHEFSENDSSTTFSFHEDSRHRVDYWCEDSIGLTSQLYTEIDVVETVAPEITKQVIGPQIGECPPVEEGDICIIDGVTEIHVSAIDPQPHPVNQVTCDWRYSVVDGNATGGEQGITPPFIINFPEESEHELTIICKDGLYNQTIDIETFFVDKTPPVIQKWYGDPWFGWQDGNNFLEWITTETPIYTDAYDPEPHPSGLATLEYRVTLVDEANCWNQDTLCQEAEGTGSFTPYEDEPFYTGEESCHLIEIKATDNVEKESIHKQCVFVDETPPIPNKIVGEPKTEWDGINSIFYPEIAEQCWQDPYNLECWKVTLFTPISLECTDPQPHPVDHETVCFNVEVDGINATTEFELHGQTYPGYCETFGGDYNANGDGYCCMENVVETFYFTEETEHNLKYYCEDALGNRGPIDDEKFKVEGTRFDIQLNRKWNLISVPFVLQDDSIEEVFSEIDENVHAVWAYDAFDDEWYVYRPSDPGASNLETIKPGNGYWVSMLEDDILTIGGSLFSPATTPPDKPVKWGWNLIGYFGTEETTLYDGPDGEGRPAYCALYSLGQSVLDKGWSALRTYWEPDNPPWYDYGYYDDMDPGAGYWIFATEDSIYSYSTHCGLFG
ncbi:hypothetical protein KKE06_01425 [Candidatus Micrarchaeota archaeon]|nr:hypothetical protein [Candidatus Micrarchaeota archaeon]